MSVSKKNAEKKGGVVLKTLKYYLPVAWRYSKRYFVVSVLNVIAQAALPFVDILFLPLLVDALCQPVRDVPLILTYAGLMVGLDAVVGVIGSQLTIYLERFEDKFLNYAREQVAKLCMEIDFALTENKEALDQIQKANDGIDWSGGIHGICVDFFGIISNIVKIVGIVAIIAVYAPWLLVIICALLGLSSLLNAKKNRIEIKWFAELSKVDRIYDYVTYEQENIRFGKDIRIYGAAGTLIAKSTQQLKRIMEFDRRKADERYPLDVLDVVIGALRDFGTYLYLGILAILNIITVGQFSQLCSAGGTFNASVLGIIISLQTIMQRCNYAYETVKLMEYPPNLQKGSRQVENLGSPHEIEFRNVSFSYPNTGVQVLKNVSIKIRAGERLSVVGLNGAGKTTFIKLLCRLYDADEGEILLDGVNIRDYDYDEYMKLFSVVFQDFQLLAFSVQDNITLGKEDTPGNVDAVLEKVGLLDKVNTLPHGRDTLMFRQFDRDGVQLSGGEQQKLAIARALYKDAPVVILDEPTAALDPVAEYEIYCRFNELVGGKTAVYISHRLSSCKFCDRIAVFSDCTIKELGTHDELVHKENGIYAEMFAAQAQYYT